MNPETLFTLRPETLSHLAQALPREAVQVAMLFDGHRRLWEVLRDSPLSGRMTLSVVGRLRSMSILDEARPAAEPERAGNEASASEAPTLLIDQASLPLAPIRSAPPPVTCAPAPALTLDEPCPAAPEPLAPRQIASASASASVATSTVAFDAHEELFFQSYQPEDGRVDTFWDLEDDPARRLRARRRAQRLQQGGWFRQVLSLF